MKRIVLFVALAFAFVSGGAAVVAVQSTPAVACNGGNC
jgi:hypothetical protein